MPREPGVHVEVKGLRDLRRDARRLGPDYLKEIQRVIKGAAEIVAREAATLAPRKTGRLAESIRGTTSGDKGIVRSPLPYAPVHEYGGSISPRGTKIQIRESGFVRRAIENKQDAIVDALGDGLEDAARRNGWS